MYGKVFRQMYKGSMSMAGWEAVVTLQQLIVLADRHGVIDMTPQAIAGETTIPLDIIQKGIETLSAPDPESRTPDEDGRRIVPLSPSRSWGWQLVNYAKYRALRDEEDRREYQRQYWHKRKDSTKLNGTQHNSTHADADADADAESCSPEISISVERGVGRKPNGAHAPKPPPKRAHATRLPDGWQPSDALTAYAERELPDVDTVKLAEEFTDYWRAAPGERGRKLDWDATWRTWVRRSANRYPMLTKAASKAAPQIRIDANGRQISG